MGSRIAEFLAGQHIYPTEMLPLCHSTPSAVLRNLLKSNQLSPMQCKYYKEELLYLFVGRPAYKTPDSERIARDWELPVCFLFAPEFDAAVRRVVPFDSGAHHSKRMPTYVQSLALEQFEITSMPDAPQRLIGAFFGTASEYLRLDPKERSKFKAEFDPTVFDFEVNALLDLYHDQQTRNVDDRSATIEVQSKSPIDLTDSSLKAVIVPSSFAADTPFRNHVESVWRCSFIPYAISPLSVAAYHSQLYNIVAKLLEDWGLV